MLVHLVLFIFVTLPALRFQQQAGLLVSPRPSNDNPRVVTHVTRLGRDRPLRRRSPGHLPPAAGRRAPPQTDAATPPCT